MYSADLAFGIRMCHLPEYPAGNLSVADRHTADIPFGTDITCPNAMSRSVWACPNNVCCAPTWSLAAPIPYPDWWVPSVGYRGIEPRTSCSQSKPGRRAGRTRSKLHFRIIKLQDHAHNFTGVNLNLYCFVCSEIIVSGLKWFCNPDLYL